MTTIEQIKDLIGRINFGLTSPKKGLTMVTDMDGKRVYRDSIAESVDGMLLSVIKNKDTGTDWLWYLTATKSLEEHRGKTQSLRSVRIAMLKKIVEIAEQ